MNMKIYYRNNCNFGDMLNISLAKVFGVSNFLHADYTPSDTCFIGSVLDRLLVGGDSLRPIKIIGTGFMNEDSKVNRKIESVVACRGKLTSDKLGLRKCMVGDPAIILPKLYMPKIETKYDIGFAPHFKAQHNKIEGAYIINLTDPVNVVLNNILSCNRVITSSLHVLIICDIYGIPVELTYKDNPNFNVIDEFKFRDYYSIGAITDMMADDYIDILDKEFYGRNNNNSRLGRQELEKRAFEIFKL